MTMLGLIRRSLLNLICNDHDSRKSRNARLGSGVGISEITGRIGGSAHFLRGSGSSHKSCLSVGGFSGQAPAQQPAAGEEWGQTLTFVKKLGLKHVVATVLVRQEEDVILRQVSVQGHR